MFNVITTHYWSRPQAIDSLVADVISKLVSPTYGCPFFQSPSDGAVASTFFAGVSSSIRSIASLATVV